MAVFELTAPKIESTAGNPAQYAQAATDAWRGVSQSLTAAQNSFRAAGDILDANGEKARQIRAQQMLEEQFKWDQADQERKVLGQKTEDAFAATIAGGPQILGGIITNTIAPSDVNKLALTTTEQELVRKAGADTIKLNSQILDKLKGQQALSDYVDNAPTAIRETEAELYQRASKELKDPITGKVLTPTRDIMKDVNTMKAAEIEAAKLYAKTNKPSTTVSEIDKEIYKVDQDLAQANDKAKEYNRKIADDMKSNKKDGNTSADYIKGSKDLQDVKTMLADKVLVLGSTVDKAAENAKTALTNAGVNPTPAAVAHMLNQRSAYGENLTLGNYSVEGMKGFADEYAAGVKAKGKNYSIDNIPDSMIMTASNRKAQLEAEKVALMSGGLAKQLSPAEIARERATADLKALLSPYGKVPTEIVKEQTVPKELTKQIKVARVGGIELPKLAGTSSKQRKLPKPTALGTIESNKQNELAKTEKIINVLYRKPIRTSKEESELKAANQKLRNLKSSLQPIRELSK